eukprot:gene11790-8101_t
MAKKKVYNMTEVYIYIKEDSRYVTENKCWHRFLYRLSLFQYYYVFFFLVKPNTFFCITDRIFHLGCIKHYRKVGVSSSLNQGVEKGRKALIYIAYNFLSLLTLRAEVFLRRYCSNFNSVSYSLFINTFLVPPKITSNNQTNEK